MGLRSLWTSLGDSYPEVGLQPLLGGWVSPEPSRGQAVGSPGAHWAEPFRHHMPWRRGP